ncbi:uncharacterized protein METZ01_LOCUS220065, partial [marine metagenome]
HGDVSVMGPLIIPPTQMHPDAVPLPQHPHNLESLGESGNPGSLGFLKSGEGRGVVSQSVNHGGSAATDYVQGGQLFRQQDGVVERQEEQGQQLQPLMAERLDMAGSTCT